MIAIILAAGRSMRLRPLTDDRPKCLLPMGSKTILDWQLDALRSVGVHDLLVVVGYRQDMIRGHLAQHPDMRITYVENPNFATTNTLFSLRCALETHEGDFYYLNADVVFDPQIMARLAPGEDGAYLAIDKKQCREEEVKVQIENGRIIAIGKHLNPETCDGEFIGVAKFCGNAARSFRAQVLADAVAGNEMQFFEYALDRWPDKAHLFPVDVTGLPCVEVDFPEDYDYAVSEVIRHFEAQAPAVRGGGDTA